MHKGKLAVAGLLAIIVLTPVSASLAACGGASSSASTHTTQRDRDNDNDNNDDDAHILNYGSAPSAAESQELTSLVRRYYAAAAVENGAKACSMLYPLLAEMAAEEHAEASVHGSRTCARAMTELFKQRHTVLTGESATLKFYRVRVKGDKALTLVSFAAIPEVRQLLERRVNGSWTIDALLDTILE